MGAGNGILLFIAGATALWIVGKGFGKNVGPAWNTLIGAQQPATAGSNVQAPGTSVDIPMNQLTQPPQLPPVGGTTSAPSPISYLGVGIAA